MSRKSARTHAFKLIYQLGFISDDLYEMFDTYSENLIGLDETEKEIVSDEFFGVAENLDYINEIISQYSRWQISRLNKVDLSLIQLAIYEILYEKNKVSIVINEIVDIANYYGDLSSPSFVNGILAQISQDIENGTICDPD